MGTLHVFEQPLFPMSHPTNTGWASFLSTFVIIRPWYSSHSSRYRWLLLVRQTCVPWWVKPFIIFVFHSCIFLDKCPFRFFACYSLLSCRILYYIIDISHSWDVMYTYFSFKLAFLLSWWHAFKLIFLILVKIKIINRILNFLLSTISL